MRWYFYCIKKERGVRLLNFFDVKESLVAATGSIWVRDLVIKRESASPSTWNVSVFSRIEFNWIYHACLSNVYLFWITVQVELISLQHCSSRNRKILHRKVHTLKFLAWLSIMIKHITPKLVAQAGLQKLISYHDLSKVICIDVRKES